MYCSVYTRYWVMTAKPTTKIYLLLGNRFVISKYTRPSLSNAFANKHVHTATTPDATMEELLEAVFCAVLAKVLSLISETSLEFTSHSRVEAGSNASTVTLGVVRGDEKGSLESETVKYGHEYQGSGIRE
jgi:hypothetical protein